MIAFDKAWDIVKGLSDYEMAVAEEFSDPRDFMTTARMRDALGGMLRPTRPSLWGRIESLADEDVRAIYNQMMRLARPYKYDMDNDRRDHRNQTFLETKERDKRNR